MDKDAENVPFSHAKIGAAKLSPVQVDCYILPCEPYIDHAELTAQCAANENIS